MERRAGRDPFNIHHAVVTRRGAGVHHGSAIAGTAVSFAPSE
jgi:hypothetical protein